MLDSTFSAPVSSRCRRGCLQKLPCRTKVCCRRRFLEKSHTSDTHPLGAVVLVWLRSVRESPFLSVKPDSAFLPRAPPAKFDSSQHSARMRSPVGVFVYRMMFADSSFLPLQPLLKSPPHQFTCRRASLLRNFGKGRFLGGCYVEHNSHIRHIFPCLNNTLICAHLCTPVHN
jgi:hypothetical protein